ncbi:hypothetical protein KM043_014877 [Ampulex compressa]|nr:hypothetical protein KM043_014877 [Ampulex compressa]
MTREERKGRGEGERRKEVEENRAKGMRRPGKSRRRKRNRGQLEDIPRVKSPVHLFEAAGSALARPFISVKYFIKQAAGRLFAPGPAGIQIRRTARGGLDSSRGPRPAPMRGTLYPMMHPAPPRTIHLPGRALNSAPF